MRPEDEQLVNAGGRRGIVEENVFIYDSPTLQALPLSQKSSVLTAHVKRKKNIMNSSLNKVQEGR